MSWLQNQAIQIVLAALPIGVIIAFAVQWIKKQSDWVDRLSPPIKSGAVFFIGAIITTVSTALGVEVVCEEGVNCLTKLDESTLKMLIEAALIWAVAKLTHKKIKRKK